MNLQRSTKFTIKDDVLIRSMQGEMVLLDLDTENYFGLNAVGARFVELAKESKNWDEIQASLLEIFDVEPEMLEADLSALVPNLVAAGLLAVSDAT